MPKFNVTLWRYETLSSSPEVEADTPAAAIETAREWADNGKLEWDHCGHQLDVDRIEAAPLDSHYDPASPDCAEWTDPKSSDAVWDVAAAMLAALQEITGLPMDDDGKTYAVAIPFPAMAAASAAIAAAQVAGIEPNAAPISDDAQRLRQALAAIAAAAPDAQPVDGTWDDAWDAYADGQKQGRFALAKMAREALAEKQGG